MLFGGSPENLVTPKHLVIVLVNGGSTLEPYVVKIWTVSLTCFSVNLI